MRRTAITLLTTLMMATWAIVYVTTASAEARTLQLAHVSVENEEDMYHRLAINFADHVARLTDGSVKVEVLGGAQLGGERDVAEGMQLGTVDMSLIASFTLGAFEQKAMVFDLPYLFKDYETAFSVLDSEFTQPIEADLETAGLKVLGWGHGGFRNLYNSKKSVRNLSDLQDIKVRIPESPIYVDTWRALGANVTSMAYPEVFTGLQQGTVDGAENPTALLYTSRFFEAAKFLSKTEHVYVAIPIVVSGMVWNSLSPEERTAFQTAADESIREQREFLIAIENETEEKLRAAGVTITIDVNKAEFREAVASVYDQYVGTIGSDLISQAKALAE